MEYPNLPMTSFWALLMVKRNVLNTPGYLDNPKCPYDDAVKSFFRDFEPGVKASVTDKVTEKSAEKSEEKAMTISELEAEATALFNDVKAFGNIAADDGAEKNEAAALKMKTSLLEKILTIKEKAMGLNEVQKFQQTVIGVMDDFLTPDQRTIFTARLKALS